MPVLRFQRKQRLRFECSGTHIQGIVDAAAWISVAVSIHQVLVVFEDIEFLKAVIASPTSQRTMSILTITEKRREETD